ncbi:MAG: hypothetical protein LBD48_07260 [Treponema sp.]|jgi:hypothetical protein|nr:hypothetical protein [Treponema sp.]
MAIQPIDLQTLFSQIDKVAKTQTAQREGLAVQQTLQGVQIQKKTEEHIQSVNEAPDSGDGAEKVKDRGAQGQEGGEEGKKKPASGGNAETEAKRSPFFKDPRLGQNIDISL